LELCLSCAAQLRAYRGELQQAMPAAHLRFAAPMSLRRRIERHRRRMLRMARQGRVKRAE
jgi:hypothetical protein